MDAWSIVIVLLLVGVGAIGTIALFVLERRRSIPSRGTHVDPQRSHGSASDSSPDGFDDASVPFLRMPSWATARWILLLWLVTLAWPAYQAGRWSSPRDTSSGPSLSTSIAFTSAPTAVKPNRSQPAPSLPPEGSPITPAPPSHDSAPDLFPTAVLVDLASSTPEPTSSVEIPEMASPDPAPLPPKITILHRYATGHVVQRVDYPDGNDPRHPYRIVLLGPKGDEQLTFDAAGCGATCGVDVDLSGPDDLDGDGLPELVSTNFSSGTQCFMEYDCHRLHLDRDPEFLWSWSGFCGVEFGDLDADGRLEIRSPETYRYVYGCGACLNADARWVHELRDNEWVVDFAAMRTSPPTTEAFETLIRQLTAFAWTEEIDDLSQATLDTNGVAPLWKAMIKLIHEGHGDLALRLHERIWPDDEPHKREAVGYLLRRLSSDLVRWSGIEPPDVSAAGDPDP